MVTVRLQGRLGNQMFQIATTIAYSLKHGIPYHIPVTTISPPLWKAYFVRLQNKHYHKKTPHVIHQERTHEYYDLPEPPKDKILVLDGWWQSEKYFTEYRQHILNSFELPYLRNPGFTSIHVRRGDYLTMQDKHPPVPYEYIRDAVFTMVSRGYKSFVVCSDDIKWCQNHFNPLKVSGAEFTYSVGHREIEDLLLMSCCEHNIIANSSFSWWAAWLNQNPNKIVISPSADNWFGPGNSNLSTKDLIPSTWIQLRY